MAAKIDKDMGPEVKNLGGARPQGTERFPKPQARAFFYREIVVCATPRMTSEERDERSRHERGADILSRR